MRNCNSVPYLKVKITAHMYLNRVTYSGLHKFEGIDNHFFVSVAINPAIIEYTYATKALYYPNNSVLFNMSLRSVIRDAR